MIPAPPVSVTPLMEMMSRLFGAQAQAAVPPTVAPQPQTGDPPLPPVRGAMGPPMPEAFRGGDFDATNSPYDGITTGGGRGLINPASLTPDGTSPIEAGRSMNNPPGRVLARLRDTTGSGAMKAIELAKGKSKWGAVAAGLAAGMGAQEQAQREYDSELAKLFKQQDDTAFSRWKDTETLRQGSERNSATANYYNALAQRGESTGRAGGGSGRTVLPEERAFRDARAETALYSAVQQQNPTWTPEQIKAEVQRRREAYGLSTTRPAAPAAAAAPPPDNRNLWQRNAPAALGGLPAPSAGTPSAVGSGQPVQVPPAAPPGTPPAKINPAPQYKVGQTATNPKTGARVRFDGKTWVPVDE